MKSRMKIGYLGKLTAMRWLMGKTHITNLPADARLSGFFHAWHKDALGIYITSESFPLVDEGCSLDDFDLRFSNEITPSEAMNEAHVALELSSVPIKCSHSWQKRDYGSWCSKCGTTKVTNP